MNTSTGAIVEEIDYDEFGNVTNDTSPGLTPFGFAGGLYDEATGLVRFGARDYDASVGRWTSKDKSRFRGGMNLYSYAKCDPVNYRDSTGRNPAAIGLEVCLESGICETSPIGWAISAALTAGAIAWWASANDNPDNPDNPNNPDNPHSDAPKAADSPGVCGGAWPGTFPGNDPTRPPAEGWEWRGPDAPGGPRGGWVNPENPGESLHPNLDNEGDGPHWDWNGPGGQRFRIFPDGTVVPK